MTRKKTFLLWLTAFVSLCLASKKDGCTHTDIETGYKFDLGPISNSLLIQVNEDFTLMFNPCKNDLFSSWNYNQQDGTLTLVQEGDQICLSSQTNKMSQIVITFSCDVQSLGTPEYEKENDCTHYISWKSSVACLKIANCETIFVPNGKYYDLNPLASDLKDYVAINTLNPAYNFYINVCRPIISVDSTCSGNTGICERSSFSMSKIGEYATTFQILSPGYLEMIYIRGSGCFSGRIRFICDRNIEIGTPAIVSQSCEYFFEWKTRHACEKQVGGGEESSRYFSTNGRYYNFLDLAGIYEIKGFDGRKYTISPCDQLTEQDPPYYDEGYGFQLHNSTMFYQIGSEWSLSYSNSTHVTIIYQNGDYCSNRVKREFSITYSCGSNLGVPLFEKEEFCHYYFSWKTSLAC